MGGRLSRIGVLGLLASACAARAPRVGTWREPPAVLVAGDLVEETRAAVRWWRGRGHHFGEVRAVGPDFDRSHPLILVAEVPSEVLGPGQAGETLLAVETDPIPCTLVGAVVQIPEHVQGADRSRVLRHELGHALGYRHFSRSGHVMNGSLELTGSGAGGLRPGRERWVDP